MRKLKIIEHVSLDGVISPGGPGEYGDDYANGGWTAPYRSPAGAAALAEAQGTGFDLLLGRRTYDLWADFWPTVKGGSVCGRSERREEICRDSQAGEPRMGSGRGPGHRRHGGCSPRQVNGRP